MKKLLTIAVAAYQVEDTLKTCLDSFLIKELLADMEILVVDDGSTDGTAELAREYEKTYPDTYRYIYRENGGHGAAVDTGIREAAGMYFKTVDGDDTVSEEGLTELIGFLRKQNSMKKQQSQSGLSDRGQKEGKSADVILNPFLWVKFDTGKEISLRREQFSGMEYERLYAFDKICDKIYINMHAATFRTELLKRKKLLDKKCFYVDAEYVLYPVPMIKNVLFLRKPVYLYHLGSETQSMHIRNMQKNEAHHKKVLDSLLNFYQEVSENLSSQKKAYLERGIAKILTSQIKIYLSYKPDVHQKKRIVKLDKKIKETAPGVYGAVTNKAVKILRGSGYHFYGVAAWLFRFLYVK